MEKDSRLADFRISTDKSELDIEMIYSFLTNSYWAKGRSRESVVKSIKNSWAFGVYGKGIQVGFARIITDNATFAYLADVFVLPEHRGIGLSKMLLRYILAQHELKDVRSILLVTKDAHKLYEQFGFKLIDEPQKYMILRSIQ